MRAVVVFLIACALAAAAPLLEPTGAAPLPPFPGWPAALEGHGLRPLPLSAREARFTQSFAGRVARFTDGRREWVVRWVAAPTRMLHPAADCFRGAGYTVTPLPLVCDAEGRHWGAFRAEKPSERLRVRECIRDDAGNSWSDASAWYWAAVLNRTRGPWWAYTVAERAP
jgi:hypothetical protein